MNPDIVFSLSNSLAMLGWLILIIFPKWKWTSRLLTGVIITLFAVIYAWLIFSTLKPGDFDSFSSLQGVMQLFSDEKAVLAGWIHFLAFDLMTGMYIMNNAQKYQINRWIVFPCLLFTFMLGPFGLLLYFLVRMLKTKSYFHRYEG